MWQRSLWKYICFLIGLDFRDYGNRKWNWNIKFIFAVMEVGWQAKCVIVKFFVRRRQRHSRRHHSVYLCRCVMRRVMHYAFMKRIWSENRIKEVTEQLKSIKGWGIIWFLELLCKMDAVHVWRNNATSVCPSFFFIDWTTTFLYCRNWRGWSCLCCIWMCVLGVMWCWYLNVEEKEVFA